MAKRKVKRPQATAADLLGARHRGPRVPRKWQEAYNRLASLRDEFTRQQTSIARDAEPAQHYSGMHMADVGTDASERDLALGIVSYDSNTVHEIDMAIERIRSGTYGICELTGKPISMERLKAIPWTRFSAQAEKALEKDGANRRVLAGARDVSAILPVDGDEAGEEDEP